VPSAVVPNRQNNIDGMGMMEPKPGAPGVRPQNPFLTPVQAADFVKLSWRTLEKMRQKGEGPTFRRHGRYIRYHIDDLEAWSNANAHRATHAPSTL
jgi:hypothetical protein